MSDPNTPFPSQKRPGSAQLPQPVKGPLGSVPPPPNPEEFYQPGSEGPLGSVAGGPSPKDLLAAKQQSTALLAKAGQLGREDNDQLESEAQSAGVSPSEVNEALRWLDQVARTNPRWLVSAMKRLDPGAAPNPESEVSDLFSVYRLRNSLH